MSTPKDGPASTEHLRESWFGAAPKFSVPPPSLAPPPPPTTRPLLTAAVGSGAGIVAMTLSGFLVHWIAARSNVDVLSSTRDRVVAGLVGAVLGAMLSLAMMQSSRLLTRVIFASVMSSAAWFCGHVVMLYTHARTLPLVPALIGACVFGASMALIPPFKRALPPPP